MNKTMKTMKIQFNKEIKSLNKPQTDMKMEMENLRKGNTGLLQSY